MREECNSKRGFASLWNRLDVLPGSNSYSVGSTNHFQVPDVAQLARGKGKRGRGWRSPGVAQKNW